MCEYAEKNENGLLMCKPKKDLCIFCVLGNKKRYNEITKESK